MSMTKDYYLVLKVGHQATADEIRSAYRHRAHELHPDISNFDSEPFLELQEAYAVLGDPALRAAYDRDAEPIQVRVATGFSKRRAPEPFREIEPVSGFR